ncbi:MAG: DUF480 domain-containing protein [Chitinivibrionales bacterium]|nr:DUF480 domain-containing protein [Chitinivibrionales bacterium]
MLKILTETEIRVLGVLIEKELTTPEYYPLTLNALVNGCNQKSNRDPVVQLTEGEVSRAVSSLKDKHLLWERHASGSRTVKYEHNVTDAYDLAKGELALLCVLLLRGPQTIGELRTRSQRMHSFENLDETRRVLDGLIKREEDPLATALSRQPGQKEERFMHLISGEPEPEILIPATTQAATPPLSPNPNASEFETRITEIEEQVQLLLVRVGRLEDQLDGLLS